MRALEVTEALPDRSHIALLPGLDGTGELFFPIIPFLESHFEIHVVKYTNQITFSDYVEDAERQLPKGVPVSLVAESFSGPIAMSLLAKDRPRFLASVLSATFCKSPLPMLTKVSKHVPEMFFSGNPASKAFLDIFLTGNNANSDVRSKSRELLEKVGGHKFKERIGLVNEVNMIEELKEIETPLLYIQATKDRIVLSDSGTEIMKHVKNMEIVKVDGPHMILQVQAKKCADLIIKHVTFNNDMQSDVAEPRR